MVRLQHSYTNVSNKSHEHSVGGSAAHENVGDTTDDITSTDDLVTTNSGGGKPPKENWETVVTLDEPSYWATTL